MLAITENTDMSTHTRVLAYTHIQNIHTYTCARTVKAGSPAKPNNVSYCNKTVSSCGNKLTHAKYTPAAPFVTVKDQDMTVAGE